jgi:hypothetical protein
LSGNALLDWGGFGRLGLFLFQFLQIRSFFRGCRQDVSRFGRDGQVGRLLAAELAQIFQGDQASLNLLGAGLGGRGRIPLQHRTPGIAAGDAQFAPGQAALAVDDNLGGGGLLQGHQFVAPAVEQVVGHGRGDRHFHEADALVAGRQAERAHDGEGL